MNIKLLCVYHKPAVLLKNDVVMPIHAGRALLDDKVRQGALTRAQARWMRENLTGDDSGDNISALNPCLNEMTVIYWAWKNYAELGDPDYIGLMHYRRQLLLDYDVKAADYLSAIGCTAKGVLRALKGQSFACWRFVPDVPRLHLRELGAEKLLDRALDILQQTDPAHASWYRRTAEEPYGGAYCNMFVFPRREFLRYCEWIFAVLLPLEKEVRGLYSGRECGMTAETLTGLYVKRLVRLGVPGLQTDLLFAQQMEEPLSAAQKIKMWRRRAAVFLLPFSKKYKRLEGLRLIRKRWLEEKDEFERLGISTKR